MPLLEGTKADELLTYWKDCQIIGFGECDDQPDIVEQFYNSVVPARLREVHTTIGIKAYQRLLHSRKAA